MHNEGPRATELIATLKAGGKLAIVSDAGTPGIADPGAVLAAEAIAAGVDVFPVPGANAVLSALIASGLPSERFAFQGFLPSKEGARRNTLEALRTQMKQAEEPMTYIVYETPHRIVGALEDIVAVFGPDHRVALARELTKLHEEFSRGSAADVLKDFSTRPSVRGEMVLVIDGRLTEAATTASTVADEVQTLITRQGLTEKDALKQVAKSEAWARAKPTASGSEQSNLPIQRH